MTHQPTKTLRPAHSRKHRQETLDVLMEALMTLGLGFGLIATAVLSMCVM